MVDLCFDVETYKKNDDGSFTPILDGTGEHFLVGSITKDDGRTLLYYDKDEMWNTILEEGRKARKQGHCVYAYAHNIKYDFYNLFKPTKDLVVLSEFPFIAIYYQTQKKVLNLTEWKKYQKYLERSKKNYSYKIIEEVVEVDIKLEAVRFVDTMSLFRMSLAKVGNMVGLEKLDLPPVLYKEELQTDIIQEYVKRDTEILMRAVKMLKRKIQEDGVGIKRLVTMNQVAISYLLKMMKETIPEEYQPLVFTGVGDNLVQGRARRKLRKAYRGGRVEAWKIGITQGVSSIDVNSLYPYSATKIRFPNLKSEIFWNKPKKELWNTLLKKIGVTRALLYNSHDELGYLPIRLPHISYFPKKGKYLLGTWTNQEINKALEEGYKILNVQFIITYEEIPNPFKEIMPRLYNLRTSKSITDFNKHFYKSVMNGGIGKFAQTRIGQEIVFDNIEMAQEYLKNNYEILGGITDHSRTMKYKKGLTKFTYKGYYSPLIPALITAQARTIMYDAYKDIGVEKLIYTDTDNITFKGDRNDVPQHLTIGEGLGEWKIEFENAEFECWGRKSKRINEEIKTSGVSKNSQRHYDKETGIITYANMQGLRKTETGKFKEQKKDLGQQAKNYEQQEKELEEPLIYIDETILKDIRQDKGDGLDYDDITHFKEDIQRIIQEMKGGKSL